MNFFSFDDEGWSRLTEPSLFLADIPLAEALPQQPPLEIRWRKLPMYESVALYCIYYDIEGKNERICYITQEGTKVRLNSTSSDIHKVNSDAPILLNEENVCYYLSFFCLFVWGADGPFYLVHDLEDKLLPIGFADTTSKTSANEDSPRKLFRRPRFHGIDDDKAWRISAIIYYGDSVFHADFVVRPSGSVEMLSDEVLISNVQMTMTRPFLVSSTQPGPRA